VDKDSDDSESETSEDEEGDKDDEGWNEEGVVKGVIAKFFGERNFGFVRPEEGDDIFFHKATVWNIGEKTIVPGLAVLFYQEEDEYNGKLKATAMKVTSWKPKEVPAKGKGKDSKGKGKGKEKGKEKGKKGDDTHLWAEFEKWKNGKGTGNDNAKNGAKSADNDKAVRAASIDDEPQSVAEWTRAQDRLFGHMTPLPEHWIRLRSKSSGAVYQYNFKTGESKDGDGNDRLPPNWQKKTSQSSGQVYYYNSKTGMSQFEEP